MARHWILQANPARWRIKDAIEHGYPIDNWALRAPTSEIAAGDDIAVWVSGQSGGVLGLGRAVGPVQPRSREANPYWVDSTDGRRFGWEVPIACEPLSPDPVALRSVLFRDPRFATSLIITMPGGANPFEVSDSAWEAIRDVVAAGSRRAGPGRSANPPWVRDEIILALDFYLREEGSSHDDPQVLALSSLIRSLPLALPRPDPERFRSPNAVYMKLQNFKAIDPEHPGVGLQAGSHLDEEIFHRFRGRPEELHRIAMSIAASAAQRLTPVDPNDEDFGAEEGAILEGHHRWRERNGKLVAKKKRLGRREDGTVLCEICDFEFSSRYGPDGMGVIDCHHLRPLSEGGKRQTALSDLALVCPNCHRMAHKVRPWRGTLAALRELLLEQPQV